MRMYSPFISCFQHQASIYAFTSTSRRGRGWQFLWAGRLLWHVVNTDTMLLRKMGRHICHRRLRTPSPSQSRTPPCPETAPFPEVRPRKWGRVHNPCPHAITPTAILWGYHRAQVSWPGMATDPEEMETCDHDSPWGSIAQGYTGDAGIVKKTLFKQECRKTVARFGLHWCCCFASNVSLLSTFTTH